MYQVVKLENVIEYISRGVTPAYAEEGITVLNQKCIRDHRILLEEARKTDPVVKRIPEDKFIKHSDVLINSTGVGTLGRVAQNKRRDLEATVDGHVTIVRPDAKKVNGSYFGYALISVEGLIERMGEGATGQTELSRQRLKEVEIPLPTIKIQQKIAAILSAYDDLIENNLRRIKILEEMAQNLYREWFVKFRFPGHQKVKMVDSPLGKIPEGWEVLDVTNIVERHSPGKLYDQKTVYAGGSVPVLDQGRSGVIGYHNDAPGLEGSEENPVIIFANHTCYQRIIHFPFSAIQNVIPFYPNPEKYRNIYWLHYATKDLISFSDYKGHWPEYMRKKVVVPSPQVAEEFGNYIKENILLCFKLQKKCKNLSGTRDLLLPKLISGELDVSKLDIAIPEANA